ncbi:hypothetical protein HK100_008541, partial [Physocladia obscura]
MSMNSASVIDDDEDIISLYYTRSSVSSTATSASDLDRRNVPTRSSSLSFPTGTPKISNDTLQMPPPPPSLSRTQSKRDAVAAKYDQDRLKVMEARRLYNLKLVAAAEESKIKVAQQREEDERRKEQLVKKVKAAAKARQEELSLPFM